VTLGLRERKKQATRAALAAAALRMAAERGNDAVTVEQIAEAAGVSARTFFNYFATKEEAFVADDLERAQALLARLHDQPLDAPLWPTLVRLLGEHLEQAAPRDRRQALAEFAVRSDPAVLAQQFKQYAGLEADLVAEITRRTHPQSTSLPARLMAATLVAAMRSAIETWVEDGSDPTPRPSFEIAAAQLALAFPHNR
jgi:AcrR family transcriptional regulator